MRTLIARFRAALGSLPRELAVTLLVTVIVTIIASPVVALLTKDRLHAWLAALIASVTFLGGLLLGAAMGAADDDENLGSKIRELESRTGELGAYETYAEHLRDALRDLRRVVAHELPSFSTRDFIETGIFEPAYTLLQRDHRDKARGDVRFSILRPEGDDFVMADGDGLFPARGHHPESRQRFRLPIRGSFAGIALDHARVQWSNDLETDTRFSPHPKASPERKYRSIVSVPLWRSGEIAGVLNVIASRKDAFSPVDRTYITLLASVIDVAESLKQPPQ
ncbi:MAG TPA: GAF domain-containing protein [Solirubrobacteraceae bacterium]|nr:GAF domain-containing protein [Solirubrobacteraceae bacterium]